MTAALIAIGITTAWLVVLTVAVMMCIRQIGAVQVRVELVALGGGGSYSHNATLGFRLADHLIARHPELSRGRKALLLVTATCPTCGALVDEFETSTPTMLALPDQLIVLVVGEESEQTSHIVNMLRGRATVVRDPLATDIARGLRLANVPSAVLLDDGIITGSLVFIDHVAQLDELASGADAAFATSSPINAVIAATS